MLSFPQKKRKKKNKHFLKSWWPEKQSIIILNLSFFLPQTILPILYIIFNALPMALRTENGHLTHPPSPLKLYICNCHFKHLHYKVVSLEQSFPAFEPFLQDEKEISWSAPSLSNAWWIRLPDHCESPCAIRIFCSIFTSRIYHFDDV